MTDIQIENHGSLFLFRPITDEGKEWLKESVSEDAQWFGNALAVEHRYAGDLAEGVESAGLKIE